MLDKNKLDIKNLYSYQKLFDIRYKLFKNLNILVGVWPGSRTNFHKLMYAYTFIISIVFVIGQVRSEFQSKMCPKNKMKKYLKKCFFYSYYY